MGIESNARSHAEAFHWWRGHPEITEEVADLRDLMALRDAADELIAREVQDIREHEGATRKDMAEVLGISAQAVRARYFVRP